jgi:hypothetical protein
MEAISIPAHFDGKVILLDEQFELKPNARLLVTVLPDQPDEDNEHLEWLNLSIQGVANACDPDEPEYSLDKIKEINPEYERR